MRPAIVNADSGPSAFLLERLVALAVSDCLLWGLIQTDEKFPPMGTRDGNDNHVAANDFRITYGAAFRFKCGNCLASSLGLDCPQFALDRFALLRARVGIEPAAADHAEPPWRNMFKPTRQKVIGRQSHPLLHAIPVIPIPELHGSVSHRHKAVV